MVSNPHPHVLQRTPSGSGNAQPKGTVLFREKGPEYSSPGDHSGLFGSRMVVPGRWGAYLWTKAWSPGRVK